MMTKEKENYIKKNRFISVFRMAFIMNIVTQLLYILSKLTWNTCHLSNITKWENTENITQCDLLIHDQFFVIQKYFG